MAADLQTLTDRLDIIDVLHRYMYAVDRRDWELLGTCFTEDATVDFSGAGGPNAGAAELVAWLADTMGLFAMTQHTVSNVLIEVSGDEATGQAYFSNPMTIAHDGGPNDLLFSGGAYDDRFRRTPQGWRIAARRAQLTFIEGPFRRA
jgi:hypothetical protein